MNFFKPIKQIQIYAKGSFTVTSPVVLFMILFSWEKLGSLASRLLRGAEMKVSHRLKQVFACLCI